MSVSVLLADDHLVVRRGLRALFEAEADLTVVGEVADGLEVVEAVERLSPDVLILDLIMPGLGGFEVLKELAARRTSTRTVVLSMHAGEEYAAEALRDGALGYVVKDASALQIVAAVRHAALGQRFLSASLSEAGIEEHLKRVKVTSEDEYDTLTPRERQVLSLAARGLTNADIGRELAISARTAEAHRANSLRKLRLKGQNDLVRFAFRRGILDL